MRFQTQLKTWFFILTVLGLCGLGTWLVADPFSALAGARDESETGDASRGPLAELPELTHDLGVIRSKGTVYHHDFIVLNAGTEVLEIREVIVG